MKKKKIMATIAILIICLSGCGTTTQNPTSYANTGNSTNAYMTANTQRNNETTSLQTAAETTAKAEVTYTTLKRGDKINTDFLEMTIDEIGTAKELASKYAYETFGVVFGNNEAEDGKSFIYVKGKITNKSAEDIYTNHSYVDTTCVCNEKYEYNAWLEMDNEYTYISSFNSIVPFETTTYYLYAEVPDGMIDNLTECRFTFSFAEDLELLVLAPDRHNLPYNYEIFYRK